MVQRVNIRQLSALSPFDEMKTPNLVALLDQIELREAKAGQTLFNEGDTAEKLFYVLSGAIELDEGGVVVRTIKGGTDAARFPLAPTLPRRQTAIAASAAEVITLDSKALDVMLTWDQTGIYEVSALEDTSNDEKGDWMIALLQSGIFQRIPPTNIHGIFQRMDQVNYKAGDTVIKQGDAGKYFYVVCRGRCKVTRESPVNDKGLGLANLGVGNTFGAEALLSGAERNATVTMLTDGTLMRLSKANFQALMTEPLLEWLAHEDAARIVAAGAQWLDVRLPAEFALSHEEGALNLPLYLLRMKSEALDPKKKYVVCCDTGRRSSAAAFILIEKGFQAAVLKGGLNSHASPVRSERQPRMERA